MQRWSDIMEEDEGTSDNDGFCHIPCAGDEIRLRDVPSTRFRVVRVINKRRVAVVVDILRPERTLRVSFESIQKT